MGSFLRLNPAQFFGSIPLGCVRFPGHKVSFGESPARGCELLEREPRTSNPLVIVWHSPELGPWTTGCLESHGHTEPQRQVARPFLGVLRLVSVSRPQRFKRGKGKVRVHYFWKVILSVQK